MTLKPGKYVAVLPADMDRMGEAKRLLNEAGGTLVDWGFREDSGIDVEFIITKPLEWPPDLSPPLLVPTAGAGVLHTVKKSQARKQATATPKTKKNDSDAMFALVVFLILAKMFTSRKGNRS